MYVGMCLRAYIEGSKILKTYPRDESSVSLGHYNIKIIKIYRLIYKNGSKAHYFNSY